MIANGTGDLGRVRQAIAGITPTSDIGNLSDALRLASALAARSGDAEILVATDAALATPPTASLEAPVRVLRVGRDAANQAIVALAVRTAPSGLSHSAFVSVANLGLELVDRQLQLFADGRLRDSRTVHLDPQRRTDVSIDDIDDAQHPASVIEVRLVGAEGATTPAADALGVDDRAWAVVPPKQERQVLLAGEPDPYLETALSFLPDTELYFRDGKDWSTLTGLDQYELMIFNRFLPRRCRRSRSWRSRRRRTSALGTPAGTLQNPGIGTIDPSDPVLRYVDLSTVHVAEAREARAAGLGAGGDPGPGRGRRCSTPGRSTAGQAAVLAFEPRHSDLPLQVAFPVLLANLAGELMGGSDTPLDAVAPGSPVTLPVPEGALGVRVERPDGSVDELVAPTQGRRERDVRADRPAGRLLGHPARRPDASAAPSGGASPGAASPGASSGAGAVGPSAAASARADVPAARGRRAEPVRGRPPRRRRVGDRARGPGEADRAGDHDRAAPGPARLPRSSARTRATSCGSRSCSSPWSRPRVSPSASTQRSNATLKTAMPASAVRLAAGPRRRARAARRRAPRPATRA